MRETEKSAFFFPELPWAQKLWYTNGAVVPGKLLPGDSYLDREKRHQHRGRKMKKTVAVIILFTLVSCGAAAQQYDTSMCYMPTKGDSVVEYAESFLGKPYKYGSCSPETGFDCSGFTWYVFNHFHVSIPRSARDYMKTGKEVSLAECRKGDIIVFRGTHKGDTRAGHVGIIISDPGEPVQFIHASSSDKHSGVVITDYYKSYYPTRFIKVIRVLD